MTTGDDVLAVAAAHRVGLVRTDQWPMVAALLVAAGHDGEALVELAGLTRTASGWEVDQLVPKVLAEVHALDLDVDRAGDVVVRLLAQSLRGPDHPVIRALEPLAPALGYPGGRIGDAHYLAEWLDCSCHEGSSLRAEADRFEEDARQLPPLQVATALVEALMGGPVQRPDPERVPRPPSPGRRSRWWSRGRT